MSNSYYWDFKFNFTAGTIAVGLVDNGSNVTTECTPSDHGIAHDFTTGDTVSFNIFDGDGGSTLAGAVISFFNAATNAASSPLGGSSTITLNPIPAVTQGSSAVFEGPFPHWVFPQYQVTVTGTFYFHIYLLVTSSGTVKVITTDPEMIVGGPAGG